MSPERREALLWFAHLCTVESDAVFYAHPPAPPAEVEQASFVADQGDQAYLDATRGLSEDEAGQIWRDSLARFAPQ